MPSLIDPLGRCLERNRFCRCIHFVNLDQWTWLTQQLYPVIDHLGPLSVGEPEHTCGINIGDGDLIAGDSCYGSNDGAIVARPFASGRTQGTALVDFDAIKLILRPLIAWVGTRVKRRLIWRCECNPFGKFAIARGLRASLDRENLDLTYNAAARCSVGAAKCNFTNARIVECRQMSLPHVQVNDSNWQRFERIYRFRCIGQIGL